MGVGGRAAGHRGGVGCVDPDRFCGRNSAILHASENLAPYRRCGHITAVYAITDFSVLPGVLAL